MSSKSEKVLGAAIFGAGWVAGEHAKAYQACPRTRLVAVGSRLEESARRCAVYGGAPEAFITTDFDALLKHPEVDIVSITTPPGFHADLTIRAARAGKHLCIEKAIALEWPDCLAMQKAVAEAGVKTIVSFCLHWNPSLVNTKRLIERGAVGKPYYVEVDYWHHLIPAYPQYEWSVRQEHGRSTLLSAGCHAVDALRWFKGIDVAVTEVTAYSVPHQGDNPDWGYDPTSVFICKFADGTVGKVASILDCEMPYQFNIDIVGTKGTIRGNRVWSTELFPGQTDWATIPTILPDSGDVTHHPFSGQMEAFVAGILDGAPILPDLNDAVKTHEIIFAADRSAATGQPVHLPLER
jgi:predicted dehydrogenase